MVRHSSLRIVIGADSLRAIPGSNLGAPFGGNRGILCLLLHLIQARTQGRVTDHRIGLTLYQLEAFLNGELDGVIDALIEEDRAKKLQESTAMENV